MGFLQDFVKKEDKLIKVIRSKDIENPVPYIIKTLLKIFYKYDNIKIIIYEVKETE